MSIFFEIGTKSKQGSGRGTCCWMKELKIKLNIYFKQKLGFFKKPK